MKTPVKKEVNRVARNPNFPKTSVVTATQMIRNPAKKVIVLRQRPSLRKNLIKKLIPTPGIKKTLLLKVLFVIKDIVSGNYLNEPTKAEIYSKITYFKDRNLHFTRN